MFELSDKTVATLIVIDNLLRDFHEHEILYCHWKSNEHLQASMLADTDLDVLFAIKKKRLSQF
jgi:hypothetical protein